jgi:hypothetical protein
MATREQAHAHRQCGLGDAVGGPVVGCERRIDRKHVNDATGAAVSDHGIGEALRQEMRRAQVCIQDRVETLGFLLEHVGYGHLRRVVDEDVEATERVLSRVDQSLMLVEIANVGLHEDGLGPNLLDLRSDLFGRSAVAVKIDDQVAAMARQLDCDRAADAAGRSCDDRCSVFETHVGNEKAGIVIRMAGVHGSCIPSAVVDGYRQLM